MSKLRMRLLIPVTIVLGLAASVGSIPADRGQVPGQDGNLDLGRGEAYSTLATLPVMHQGRVKPLDTLARFATKTIFGRQKLTLTDRMVIEGEAGEDQVRETVQTWTPVAAMLNWSVDPDAWDQRAIILCEHLPLKRLLIREQLREAVAKLEPGSALADRAEKLLSPPETEEAQANAEDPEQFGLYWANAQGFQGSDLIDLARANGMPKPIAEELTRLGEILSRSSKHLTPEFLRNVRVRPMGDEGPEVDFTTWHRDILERDREADNASFAEAKPISTLEKRVMEVGQRWMLYRSLRDRVIQRMDLMFMGAAADEPLLIMPCPVNQTYLQFTAGAIDTYLEAGQGGGLGLTALQQDALDRLNSYIEFVPNDEKARPGTDEVFDAKFSEWLQKNSRWMSLAILLGSEVEELERAGFDADLVLAFQQAFRAYEDSEFENPGEADEQAASRLVNAARDLGESTESNYPTSSEIGIEVRFNQHSPFYYAPIAYLLGLGLLTLSLIPRGLIPNSSNEGSSGPTLMATIATVLYAGGLTGLIGGIGLEIYGFYHRVMISGWAPVTNMYETVIWVGLVTAVLGLTMELFQRQTYAALAASGIAGLCTLLAASVPLLDDGSQINTLQPVLQSQYWLVVHVLTIVSSYAAFALALGLGLVSTGYYLTASYRRNVGFFESLKPSLIGLPVAAIGSSIVLMSNTGDMEGWMSNTRDLLVSISGMRSLPGWMLNEQFVTGAYLVALIGGTFTLAGPVALLAERLSRATFATRNLESLMAFDAIGDPAKRHSAEDALRVKDMNATATKVKPLASFIYRAFQVGVLLVTAGTILGGVWADDSWGRFWGWDPKEVWALITLLVYLVPLHGRFAGWINNFGLTIASVVCFSAVLMAWYGVNFVIGVGLHSYGFVDGGGQKTVFAAVAVTLSLPVAAVWRRHLGRKVQPILA